MLQLMPVTDGKHSEHATLSFEVRDIEKIVDDLESGGVRFQDYDLPDPKTAEHHLCTTDSEKCAWFMDTENDSPVRPRNPWPAGRIQALNASR